MKDNDISITWVDRTEEVNHIQAFYNIWSNLLNNYNKDISDNSDIPPFTQEELDNLCYNIEYEYITINTDNNE